MKKHVPVTDMTAGLVYDSMLNGEQFYCHGKRIVYADVVSKFSVKPDDLEIELNMTAIRGELMKGTITRLVEVPWTDQLDGTWENGVWCMCVYSAAKPAFAKVLAISDDLAYCCYDIDNNGVGMYFDYATPLPQHLADELEKLAKENQQWNQNYSTN